MKRIVDVFTSDWSPEIVWTYIISIEGDVNPIDLNQDEVDLRAFEASDAGEVVWFFA